MDKVAVAIGVIVLLGLIALIVKSLRDDKDDVVENTATSQPAAPAVRPAADAGTTTPSRPEPARREPVLPVEDEAAPPQPTVDHTDAPPMVRRVPRADRTGDEKAAPPATPVAPAAPVSPTKPAASAAPARTEAGRRADTVAQQPETDAQRRQVPPPAGDALPVRRATDQAGLARRQATASTPEPLVKPEDRKREAPRDPEAVRRSMSGLQAGVARARRAADESGEPPAGR